VKQLQLHKLTNNNEVICLVGVEDQKRCSAVLDLSKTHGATKGTPYSADCLEGFLLYLQFHLVKYQNTSIKLFFVSGCIPKVEVVH
jgi:hypothetical protein